MHLLSLNQSSIGNDAPRYYIRAIGKAGAVNISLVTDAYLYVLALPFTSLQRKKPPLCNLACIMCSELSRDFYCFFLVNIVFMEASY